MSSPSHRRQRSSQSTPRRTTRSSHAPSSPPDPSSQLQGEASQHNGNNTTPRGHRAPPSSSPMFFQSSPADADGNRALRDVSSPLRQMTNTQTTQQNGDSQSQGDRTPRASGQFIGSEILLEQSGFYVQCLPVRFFSDSICIEFSRWGCPRQPPTERFTQRK